MSTLSVHKPIKLSEYFCFSSLDKVLAVTCGALAIISQLGSCYELSSGISATHSIFYGSLAGLCVLATQQARHFMQNIKAYMALSKAIEEGDVKTVVNHAKSLQHLSKRCIFEMLTKVTQKNQGELITFILQRIEPLLDQELGELVKLACQMRHEAAVCALFQSQRLSESYQESVLCQIISQEKETVIDIFLKSQHPLTDTSLGRSILAAAQSGRAQCVEKLLIYSHAILPKMDINTMLELFLNEGIEQASINGHINVLDVICSHFNENNQPVLQSTAIAAAKLSQVDILHFLLTNKSYKSKILWPLVLIKASQEGQLESLVYLLDKNNIEITQLLYNQLMEAAVEFNQINILEYLIKKDVSLLCPQTRINIIMCLSKLGQTDMLNDFFYGH
jgi:hypothetical protein